MFDKILIANRGEIAVRIIRACKELGISTVSVFSEVDRTAQHVLLSDEAYFIGPSPASESYLVGDKIINVALKSGANAIHPGYGFLSENSQFASHVIESGITWIGPPPEAIAQMGSKTEARVIMQQAGVPIVPGTPEGIASADEAYNIAEQIGYPVLIKAAMGGGGKGMRVVQNPEDLKKSFRAARRESEAAFSSSIIYLEKYLEKPRHIEFQVFADKYGNTIHLGERECSIQRRHQKVVEESPCPIMTEELRQKMGDSAVKAAMACNYENAGTVEFLVDQEMNYYFLEMNTRLQVEHPITEMVTGIDLCQLQIKVAAGEKLPFSQEEIKLRGHAIEVRIYSEDSLGNFLPVTGRINYLKPPDGPGIREDSGVCDGDEISIYYDPMISKLIAFSNDRDGAIRKMRRALEEYRISGVSTTIPFGLYVMDNPAFKAGNIDTSFVDRELDTGVMKQIALDKEKKIAIAAAWKHHNRVDLNIIKGKLQTNGSKNNIWKNNGRKAAQR